MAKSIIIDPGHGGTDPGAIGFGVHEKEWTLRVSLYQYERLKELGAKVGITRTTDKTLDAVPRTNLIKGKYDLCISNHWNSFNGSARGIETIHSIFGGKEFATSIANALVKATDLPLRRVFTRKLDNSNRDYYFMHRLTGSTRTVIVEYGFIDNVTDHNWYKNESNFIKAAEAVIEAVCKEIGITYKSPSGSSKPATTKPKPAPKPSKPASKSIDQLAREVIDGKHGTGDARKKALGSQYNAVQKRVNELLGVKPKATSKPSKSVETLAREVIDGKHGTGEARKKALGSQYQAVQNRVNQILGGGTSSKKSIDTIAREVIDGKWGNDPERSRKLRNAGYDAKAVQKRVNQLL